MALSIEIPFQKEIHTGKSVEEAFAYSKNPEIAIGKNFPGLEKLVPEGKLYRWVFEKLSYSGYDLAIGFKTAFDWKENKFFIKPESETGHRLNAEMTFSSDAKGSKIKFDMKITLELPVPALMKGMVQPLAQKEITKLLERFTDNLGRALA